MAAVDPTEEPEADEDGKVPAVPRSTLRLVKRAFPGLDDDEDDEIDEETLQALLANAEDDDEDEEEDDDDEPNGGPSDPAKSKKNKQAVAIQKLLEATQDDDEDDDEDEDDDMEDAKPNGIIKALKGKSRAAEDDDEDEDDEDSDDDSDGADLENFVICTLDTEKVGHSRAVSAHSIHRLANALSSIINSPLTSPSAMARRSSSL